MSKQTIFLSHSNRDEHILRPLKDILISKLGGTVDIFLSSDGQSIPFGRNWVHKIEEALECASLMFVFVSPNSLRSNWIYFESGYAYSKGIKVIPVGILGIDLTLLDPPLSLLQGFNIRSENSLNNLINIVNSTFNFTFPENFIESEFDSLFRMHNIEENSHFKEYAHIVQRITLDEQMPKARLKNITLIQEYLKKENISFQSTKFEINIHGLSFSWHISSDTVSFKFRIDPLISKHTVPILKNIYKIITENDTPNFSFIIWIDKSLLFVEEIFRQTARMFKTEINLKEENSFLFKDIIFKLERDYDYHQSRDFTLKGIKGPIKIYIKCDYRHIDDAPLYELLNRLFEYGILSYS